MQEVEGEEEGKEILADYVRNVKKKKKKEGEEKEEEAYVRKVMEFKRKTEFKRNMLIADLANLLFESARSHGFLGVSEYEKAVNLVKASYGMPDIEDLMLQFRAKEKAAEIWEKLTANQRMMSVQETAQKTIKKAAEYGLMKDAATTTTRKRLEASLLSSDESSELHTLTQGFLGTKDHEMEKTRELWAKICNHGKPQKQDLQDFDTRVFARAFKAPFMDQEGRLKSLLSILDTLLSEARGKKQVIAATSVLQSSGTGKSRSFVELSALGIFVCYCSFQEKSGSPLRTPHLADELLSEKDDKEAHCRAYIRSWLQCLAGYLKGEIVPDDKGGASSSTSAAPCRSKEWTLDHVILEEPQRSLILQKVAAFWDLEPFCNADELVSTWKEVHPLLPPRHGVRIVFMFDEAGLIFSAHEEVGLNLRRVFLGSELSAVGIFVDTSCSKLALSAPSPEMDLSFRICSGKVVVPNPIWKISSVNSLISNGLDDWESRDDYTLGLARNKLYRYGRPLWASFMDSMSNEGKSNFKVVAEVEQFAAVKLCGGVDAQLLFKIRNGEHLACETAIAILGARLVLDVLPQSTLAVNLVANHMRFVINISSDRTALVTCEAWDPVITAAACNLFHYNRFRLAALRKLAKAVEKSWVEEGQNGEIVARYILIRAADEARSNGHVMHLRCFLQVLCGDTSKQGFKKIKETWTEGQFIKDVKKRLGKSLARLRRGLLNFKGFHAVIGYTPTVSDLLEFFKLEKAVLCKVNHAKFDIILPVLLPCNGQYILEPENMSAAVIQVMSINGKVKLKYEATIGMNPLGVIGDWKGDQPFASVLMQLGATEDCHAEFLHVERRIMRSVGAGGASSGIHMPFIIYGLKSMYMFLSDEERKRLSDMIHRWRHPMMASSMVEFAKSIMPPAF